MCACVSLDQDYTEVLLCNWISCWIKIHMQNSIKISCKEKLLAWKLLEFILNRTMHVCHVRLCECVLVCVCPQLCKRNQLDKQKVFSFNSFSSSCHRKSHYCWLWIEVSHTQRIHNANRFECKESSTTCTQTHKKQQKIEFLWHKICEQFLKNKTQSIFIGDSDHWFHHVFKITRSVFLAISQRQRL